MKNLLVSFLLLSFITAQGQLDANSVFTLPTATFTEITAITDAQEGAMAYATDTDNVYRFDGSTWTVITSPNTSSAYFGVFIITGTGSQTITGLPFQPSQISFVAHANVEVLNLNSDNAVGNNNRFLPNSFGTGNGFARNDSGSIVQQSIYVGGSGNSINDISRYASSSHCVGIRYGNQNGDLLGLTTASLTSFNSDGFTINIDNHADDLVVLFEAYD
ncbi:MULTISPECIES: hypothetical protein [Flavobacteriaceae]|uniref:hypothetical protein n=1 Tax=Flavobacteriaceae TaxID=49546 RepID=UPI0014930944|nr:MULTISPECIES: hypothetical protein [Allomuricauda]MDC6366417.1 hypothetical protein [Muricauda sp. AC10]